ncbi:MAG: hypothetical protein FJ088_08920, partial [Deltaproteobacteria bacterium]|nr:hypothetical protein [Deltaproteobacteria bacterium]
DPLKYDGKELTFNNITGTLRNVSFLRPQWILEPRCNDDLNIDKDYIGSDKACIQPRIIVEDVGM